MKSMSKDAKRLIADFFVNIGVAWFAAGVIGIFISHLSNATEILVSVTWGIGMSVLFLLSAIWVINTKRRGAV